jgi:hypothetical protein
VSFTHRFQIVAAAAGLATALAACAAAPAYAAGPFRPFLGAWSGSGEITSMDGRKEPIRCRATYEGGDGDRSLTQSLVCASDAFRVNIESNVTAEGGNLRGEWRETTRGVQGTLSGSIGGGDFEGEVQGAGFTARVSLRSNGKRQAVYIRPSAGDIQSVNVTLSRTR